MKPHTTALNKLISFSLQKMSGEAFSLEEGEGLAVCGKPKHLICDGIPAQPELSDCFHLPSKMSIPTSLKIETSG